MNKNNYISSIIVGFSLIFMSVSSLEAQAFTVDGINYTVLTGTNAAVASNKYASGEIVIQNQITYNGTTYTVTEISDEAFSSSDITSVKLPETITTIGDNAFLKTDLTELIIPNSVTAIGDGSFALCSSLEKLQLGSSVREIGADIFTGLSSLKTVISLNPIPPTVDSWGTTYTSATLYVPESAIPAYSSVAIWNEFEKIEAYKNIGTGYFSNLRELEIGNIVEEIPAGLFSGCSTITSLTLGSSLTTIGDEAFNGCTGLNELILPPAVETIGASSFAGCSQLSSIIMGSKVKTIGEKAFDGCPAKTISITAQTPPTAPNNTFSSYSGKLYLQGHDAVDAYYDAFTCWDRFDGYVMIEASGIEYTGEKKIIGKPGDTFQLTATLMPENVTLPQIFWRSTNPDIATVDANGLVTIHADLNEVMAFADDEDESGRYCKIIAESLYADGPVLELTVSDAITGIEDIWSESVNDSAIDFNSPLDIYNLNGLRISSSVDNLTPGIYIVRQGNAVRKISVK